MVIDTSALIAIFLGEPEANHFDEAIAKAKIKARAEARRHRRQVDEQTAEGARRAPRVLGADG
jgi:uncharacterized protein with PIN domain